jgi:hypothetical protein
MLNNITLFAEVGGCVMVGPFMVTKVYVLESKDWILVSSSFNKLLTNNSGFFKHWLTCPLFLNFYHLSESLTDRNSKSKTVITERKML